MNIPQKLRHDSAKPVARQLAASLAPAVTAVRAPRLDRMAWDLLADRCAAAAARHELTGHLPCVARRWRKRSWWSTSTRAAACWSRGLDIMNPSFVVYQAQPSSLDTLVLVGEIRVQAGLLTICILLREASWCARPSELANLFHIWGTAQDLSTGVRLRGSSAPAPSCWRERRRQTSWAAAAPQPARTQTPA